MLWLWFGWCFSEGCWSLCLCPSRSYRKFYAKKNFVLLRGSYQVLYWTMTFFIWCWAVHLVIFGTIINNYIIVFTSRLLLINCGNVEFFKCESCQLFKFCYVKGILLRFIFPFQWGISCHSQFYKNKFHWKTQLIEYNNINNINHTVWLYMNEWLLGTCLWCADYPEYWMYW